MSYNPQQAEADKRLAVKFYKKAVLNKFQSKLQEKQVFEDKDYISVLIPGDSLTVVDRPVKEEDKQRFKPIWDKYLDEKKELQVGTPLAMLPGIDPSQVESFKPYNVYTVEQLEGLGEKAIQKIPQSRELVERARKFLNGDKERIQLQNEVNELKKQLIELKGAKDESTDDNSKRSGRDGTIRQAKHGNK